MCMPRDKARTGFVKAGAHVVVVILSRTGTILSASSGPWLVVVGEHTLSTSPRTVG